MTLEQHHKRIEGALERYEKRRLLRRQPKARTWDQQARQIALAYGETENDLMQRRTDEQKA
jgi:hypothetical protein